MTKLEIKMECLRVASRHVSENAIPEQNGMEYARPRQQITPEILIAFSTKLYKYMNRRIK